MPIYLDGLHLQRHEKKGDILYFDGVTWRRLPAGSAGQVLEMVNGIPTWTTEPIVSVTAITTLQSATFAVNSTGIKTLTTAHGLSVTPAVQGEVMLTVFETTNVDDWAYNLLKVESTDATNIVAKINVSTASATGGATARLGIMVITGV